MLNKRNETSGVNNAHWLAENDVAIDVHKEKAKEQLYDIFFISQYKEKYWKAVEKATGDDDLITLNLIWERKYFIEKLKEDRSRRPIL